MEYLESCIKRFEYYKQLGEKAILQVSDEKLNWQPSKESNSITIIVHHLSGNMLSRWTDFLTTDGEKEWRKRDEEFEPGFITRPELMKMWEKGWGCLFSAIKKLNESDLGKTVYIRNEPHTVIDAINRQLAHYPYHIGQIVYISKLLADEKWISLSIPRNKSKDFNDKMFSSKP